MNEEELKAGERYNFTLLYTGQSINNKFRFESPTGIHYILGLGDMEAVSPVTAPENGTKNTAPAPKYDPCRKFRKGDKVEYLPKDGRELFEAERLLTQTLTVVEDEHEKYNRVEVKAQNGDVYSVPFYYLKLVTPVEELGPYKCGTGIDAQLIFINDERFAEFEKEEDAKRVCAWLNAEHRKENA